MRSLDKAILDEILTKRDTLGGIDAASCVDDLCRWWNANAPSERTGATHIGVYIETDSVCRNVDQQDRTFRFAHQFESAGSSARCGDIVLEFRRAEECGPNDYVSFDLAGNAIESNRHGSERFRQWSDQAMECLVLLRGRFGRHDKEGCKAYIPHVE